MLDTMRDDTRNVQHETHNPKFEKMDYSDIPSGSIWKIKGPAHLVEGDHHLRRPDGTHVRRMKQHVIHLCAELKQHKRIQLKYLLRQ